MLLTLKLSDELLVGVTLCQQGEEVGWVSSGDKFSIAPANLIPRQVVLVVPLFMDSSRGRIGHIE